MTGIVSGKVERTLELVIVGREHCPRCDTDHDVYGLALRHGHSNGSTKPQVKGAIMGSERPRAMDVAGARPTPTEEARA